MPIDQTEGLKQIESLFESQHLAVLSTQKNGQPYASLMAFTATQDLSRILFLTPMKTRKYDYLIACPEVAILVHNSTNTLDDFTQAVAVTATGRASTLTGIKKEADLPQFLTCHPGLKSFAADPTTALVSVAIRQYILVSQFQDKLIISMPNDAHA